MSLRGKRQGRILRKSDFQKAYDGGHRLVSPYFVGFIRRTELGSARLGVVASRKVGNAVCRNRAKRVLREAYRRVTPAQTPSLDIVLVARRAIVEVKAQRVEQMYRERVLPMLQKMS